MPAKARTKPKAKRKSRKVTAAVTDIDSLTATVAPVDLDDSSLRKRKKVKSRIAKLDSKLTVAEVMEDNSNIEFEDLEAIWY